jgi:hypothetical protein
MNTQTTVPARRMGLKYCERCGTLWLRRSGGHKSLCSLCVQAERLLLSGRFLQLWNRLRTEVGR